ncbi:MAG: tetratricopeptide repeat protein [Acidobacteria bacterium]|nr:tetratricopeptide repeat protein [Acidobacteriota bacterium]
MAGEAHRALSDLLSRPEGSWSLADGALAIARLGRPGLDPGVSIGKLDRLGEAARAVVGQARHPRFVSAGIARVLFQDERFRIASEAENDVASCYLDAVLQRRTGTPTLLALVFIEVARRCSTRFEGVVLPGRFLLRHDQGERLSLYDPERGARPVTIDECRRLVNESTGGRVEFREAFLRPITPSQMLARIVGNLKAVFWRVADHEMALEAVRLLLTIRPDDPREIRDRGRLLFLLGRFKDAIAAFEEYLAHNPRGEDADVVRMLLLEARAGLNA